MEHSKFLIPTSLQAKVNLNIKKQVTHRAHCGYIYVHAIIQHHLTTFNLLAWRYACAVRTTGDLRVGEGLQEQQTKHCRNRNHFTDITLTYRYPNIIQNLFTIFTSVRCTDSVSHCAFTWAKRFAIVYSQVSSKLNFTHLWCIIIVYHHWQSFLYL